MCSSCDTSVGLKMANVINSVTRLNRHNPRQTTPHHTHKLDKAMQIVNSHLSTLKEVARQPITRTERVGRPTMWAVRLPTQPITMSAIGDSDSTKADRQIGVSE